MKIDEITITKLLLSDIPGLDPIGIYAQTHNLGQGSIVITCYGQSWTAYWGGMSYLTIEEFFCSCDEHYLAGKLSDIDSEMNDIDAINELAESKGLTSGRDDPWNDYQLLTDLYGDDMYSWNHLLPKKTNPDYQYLCRIINAVKEGFSQLSGKEAS